MRYAYLGELLSRYGRAYHDAMRNSGRYGTKERADAARKKIIRYVQRTTGRKAEW